MNLYSIDIKVAMTAYIKAESEEEALKIAKSELDTTMTLAEDSSGEIPIDGSDFRYLDSDVSLSPAITLHGPWDDPSTMELVETDIDRPDDDDDVDAIEAEADADAEV